MIVERAPQPAVLELGLPADSDVAHVIQQLGVARKLVERLSDDYMEGHIRAAQLHNINNLQRKLILIRGAMKRGSSAPRKSLQLTIFDAFRR